MNATPPEEGTGLPVGHHGRTAAYTHRVTSARVDDVGALLDLPHAGRTRLCFSLNAASVARRFQAATSPVHGRLAALGAMAADGYPVGVTIAPIMPVAGWQEEYGDLLDGIAAAVTANADLTVECITHRFTRVLGARLLYWT